MESTALNFLLQNNLLKTQDFADRLGLKGTASRRVWGLDIGTLGNMSQASLVEVLQQRRKIAGTRYLPGLGGIAMHAHPGFHKGTNELWPDHALMIRRITVGDSTCAARPIAGLSRRQGAQPERGPEAAGNGRNNPLSLGQIEPHQGLPVVRRRRGQKGAAPLLLLVLAPLAPVLR